MARVSIEDCLEYVPNRFALVSIAADRTRVLLGGVEPFIRSRNKEGVTALREIAAGYIRGKQMPEDGQEPGGTEN